MWRVSETVWRGRWSGNCGPNSRSEESRMREPWKGLQREPRQEPHHVQRAEETLRGSRQKSERLLCLHIETL